MSKEKKEVLNDILYAYKILAYTDNILDALYKIQNAKLEDCFAHLKRSCRNFENRILGKKNMKPENFLQSIFTDKEGGEEFEKYRKAIDNALNHCLNIHPADYPQLEQLVKHNVSEEHVIMSISELRKLIVDARLSTLSNDKYLEKCLSKRI